MALTSASTAGAHPPLQAPPRPTPEARLVSRLGERRFRALLAKLAECVDDVSHAGPITARIERHHAHGGVVVVGKVLVTADEVIPA